MQKLFILTLSIFFLSLTHAQNSQNLFQDIEEAEELSELSELEEDLELADFDSVDQLSELNQNSESDLPPRILSKPRLKTKWTPQTFRAILKKGSILTRLKDNHHFTTNRRLFVTAREKVARGNISYLLDKNKKIVYQTETKNLISIRQDLKLYPQIDPRKSYEKRTQFHSTDKELKIETDINFHIESLNVDYFTLFYGGDSSGARATRFGIRSFYRSIFPVNFGLSVSYQGGSWSNAGNQENVTWNALYFGPVIKYDLYEKEKLKLNAQFGVENSFGLEAVSDSGRSFSFKSLLWQLEIKALYDTLIGTLSLGLEYKKQRANMESTNAPSTFEFLPTKGSITGIGMVLGYHFDFNL